MTTSKSDKVAFLEENAKNAHCNCVIYLFEMVTLHFVYGTSTTRVVENYYTKLTNSARPTSVPV